MRTTTSSNRWPTAEGFKVQRHILLVDDNPNDLELALNVLDLDGNEAEQQVTVASSGQEALRLLLDPAEPLPDLVLLDLKMPHMDGIAVLDAIRAEDALRDIPVVMLTTSGEERDIRESYAHGATAYVVKPLDFGQFREAMQTIRAFWMHLNRPPRLN